MLKYKSIILFTIFLVAILLIPSKIEAAKKFVPKKTANYKISKGSIPAIVRFRPDRLGIFLSFSNFAGIESVSYSFTYNTNGVPQGAGGTITSTNNPLSTRELLFGTCSTAVCTYHRNITNARLTLTARFTNGKTMGKNYRIKTYQ